jgi:hypothetical protein
VCCRSSAFKLPDKQAMSRFSLQRRHHCRVN